MRQQENQKSEEVMGKWKGNGLLQLSFSAFLAIITASFSPPICKPAIAQEQIIEEDVGLEDPKLRREEAREQHIDLLLDRLDVERSTLQEWMGNHGTETEADIFYAISDFLDDAFSSLKDRFNKDGQPSNSEPFFIHAQSSLTRIAFFIVGSLRIWLAAALLGLVIGFRSLRSYAGKDLLGLCGNERIFFSGARISLDAEMRPADLFNSVPSLRSPTKCSQKEWKSSLMSEILVGLNICNKTNLNLGRIIVKHRKMPAFLGPSKEGRNVDYSIDPLNLEEYACMLIKLMQILRSECKGESSSLKSTNASVSHLSKNEFHLEICAAIFRVLQPEMRAAIAEIKLSELVTLALATQVGKVVSFKRAEGKWISNTLYVNLESRAILFSISDFLTDYEATSRGRLQRALTFASRQRSAGLSAMPLDLDAKTYALRQIAELLFSEASCFRSTVDDLEFFGLSVEANQKWCSGLFERVAELEHLSEEGVYTYGDNLVLMPLKQAMTILQSALSTETIARIQELAMRKSQKDALSQISAENQGVDRSLETTLIGSSKPLSYQEIARLSSEHEIPIEIVKSWSALRIVLDSSSWLAKRVGEASVPDGSILFCLMKASEETMESGDSGLISQKAMIPLRGTRLRERFGSGWQSHFIKVDAIGIAETKERFEELLKTGIPK